VLEALFELKRPVQVVMVAGRSEEMKTKLEAMSLAARGRAPHIAVKVIGYTDEMHLWMSAADLFIGKPGGLTTSEAMASGLPMVIVAPIPGQEERNSDHLLEKGIAIKCNEFTTLPYKLDQLLGDPERMARMRAQALHYGRADAAQTVVRTLLEDDNHPQEPISLDKVQQDEIAAKAVRV